MDIDSERHSSNHEIQAQGHSNKVQYDGDFDDHLDSNLHDDDQSVDSDHHHIRNRAKKLKSNKKGRNSLRRMSGQKQSHIDMQMLELDQFDQNELNEEDPNYVGSD